MRRFPGAFRDLNVSGAERLKAALALAFVVSSPFVVFGQAFVWAWLLLLSAVAVANIKLLGVFVRCGGLPFAIVGLLFHQLHLCYSAATYVTCRVLPLSKRG